MIDRDPNDTTLGDDPPFDPAVTDESSPERRDVNSG